ncbi:MAG TPA: cytochrome c [Acetobacteraceae bacterium]|nr:cytochrome c [Acetobacteraceae bacterium]
MLPLFRQCAGPARRIGPAFLFLLMAFPPRPAAAAPPDDHQAAVATLSDVKAAIAQIDRAERSYGTDKTAYRRLAQRAINALVGTGDSAYVKSAGDPGDGIGAIGHINRLLDRRGTQPWMPPLQGASANLGAAVVRLHDALLARNLMRYQIAASRALGDIEVAEGRPTDLGVLGGIEGALASTVLGVPAGASVVDACHKPRAAPAFGTHDGYLAFVTVPATAGVHRLAGNAGGVDVTVRGKMLILHTPAASLVAKACGQRTDAAPVTSPVTLAASTAVAPAASAASLPALYTQAQARAGQALYATHCVSCHGANLQGVAAPSVAGNDFRAAAARSGWNLHIIRYVVVTLMPFNAPGTLKPAQYADALAFLLASNCFPAGSKPFPETDQPGFAKVLFAPPPRQQPGQDKFGVCAVH